MTAAAMHKVVMAIIPRGLMAIVGVAVRMTFGQGDGIRDAGVLVVFGLSFDHGLDAGRANKEQRRDQRLDVRRQHEHGSIT